MLHLVLIVIVSFLSGNVSSYIFPEDFKFGVATASYQIEGGWDADGKGENIWDHLLHTQPDYTKDHQNGDVACNSYYFWEKDIQILKDLGVHFYRFSLSWSRILPTGRTNYVNPDGINYYNNLINKLLENNIEPMVTLYHWDLPQPLQDLGGWTNEIIAENYEQYADLVFEKFGDRVKKWITFNEPIEVCGDGYGTGAMAPAKYLNGIADYICGRTLLLSHARAYRLYENKYKGTQQGTVGITINTIWAEPKTSNAEDVEAAERNLQMDFGWWMNPIFSKEGDYPNVMKERVRDMSLKENYPSSRLPSFSQEEIDFIKGTADFLGLNHYSSNLLTPHEYPLDSPSSRQKDQSIQMEQDPNWQGSNLDWLKVVPWGFRKILKWIKDRYDNPLVYITENGFTDDGALDDYDRVNYYKQYLEALLEAIYLDGCNVKGYTAWSLMDNFEWKQGYGPKFGIYYTNFSDPLKERIPKLSSYYYKHVIETGNIDDFNLK